MEKILKVLNSIPDDKLRHFVIGLIVFSVSCLVFSQIVSLIILFILATSKEVYDFFHKDIHSCDFWDFIATVSGSLPILIQGLFK